MIEVIIKIIVVSNSHEKVKVERSVKSQVRRIQNQGELETFFKVMSRFINHLPVFTLDAFIIIQILVNCHFYSVH